MNHCCNCFRSRSASLAIWALLLTTGRQSVFNTWRPLFVLPVKIFICHYLPLCKHHNLAFYEFSLVFRTACYLKGHYIWCEEKEGLKQSSEDMGLPCGLEGCSQTVESKGQCSGCKDIHYCCKEHQVKDWKRHKKECKEKAKAGFKEKAAAPPPFHEEYKESFPEDHLGFSTLYSRFQKITVLTTWEEACDDDDDDAGLHS